MLHVGRVGTAPVSSSQVETTAMRILSFPTRKIVALTAVCALGMIGLVGGVGPTPTAQAAPTTTSAEHPYGDPVWLPLRTPASVGCANTGCDNSTSAHNYWALDFLGKQGDPVHAAGAGIAHVGANIAGCGSTQTEGRWVWIDHGAGVVSRYHHLNRIWIAEGQLVTPATKIGELGNSGDISPCTNNYVHFEVRNSGLKGPRVNPGQLYACTSKGKVQLPGIWGATSWDDKVVHPRPRLMTPAATSTCIESVWTKTPNVPAATARPGSSSATLSWATPPSGTNAVSVLIQKYHPSSGSYGSSAWKRLSGAPTSHTVTGLENGRTYRMMVAFHNTGGWSKYSYRAKVIPGTSPPPPPAAPAVPGAPKAPLFLTWPRADYLHYGWEVPASNGSALTSYTTEFHCRAGSASFGSWIRRTQSTASHYANLGNVTGFDTCEVKVRAENAIGSGPWSVTSTIRHS